MLRWIVAAAALAGAVPAAAADWYAVNLVGAAPNRQVGMVDAASIDRADPRKTIFKAALLYEQPLEGEIRLLIVTNVVDCAAKTIQIIHIQGFDLAGAEFASEPYTEEPRAILPNTAVENERLAVCENQLASIGRSVGERTMIAIAEEFFGS